MSESDCYWDWKTDWQRLLLLRIKHISKGGGLAEESFIGERTLL